MLQLKTATIVVFCVAQICGINSWCKWAEWTEWECARSLDSLDRETKCTAYRRRKCKCPETEEFNATSRSCRGPKEQFNKYAPKKLLCSGSICHHYPTGGDAGKPWCDWEWSSWNANCITGMRVRRAVRYCLCQSEIDEKHGLCSYGDREYKNQTEFSDHGCRKEMDVEGKWCPWNPWQSCTGTCDKHGRTRVRTRTRTCECPSPKYGGNDCESYGKPTKEIISCCEEDNLSANPIYIGASAGFALLVIIFIILGLYCCWRNQAHAASPLTSTTGPTDINPGQTGQRQEYFYMGFVNLPPPYESINEAAPPSYNELFQDETLTQEEITETPNL